jgi:hypothetical protein
VCFLPFFGIKNKKDSHFAFFLFSIALTDGNASQQNAYVFWKRKKKKKIAHFETAVGVV